MGVSIWHWNRRVEYKEPEIDAPQTSIVDTIPNVVITKAVVANSGKMFRQEFEKILGVKEIPDGSNRGPEVDEFIRYCGLEPDQQWCGCTFSWVYGQTGLNSPRSGYTPTLVPRSRIIYQAGQDWKQFYLQYRDSIDQMILSGSLYIKSKGRDGHLFAIVHIDEENVYSYDGNVSDMCLAKKRHYKAINKICNWSPSFVPNKNTKLLGAKAVSGQEKTD